MSTITRIIIIATILYLHPSHYSTSFIHSTVPGLLTLGRRIDLIMMVEDLHGTVLYCVDSERNRVGIEVIEGQDAERLVRIMFNKRYYIETLYKLCGCHQCEAREVRFIIMLNDTSIGVSCNSEHHLSPRLSEISYRIINKVDVGVRYPVPLSMANERNVTFIAIGNIGPMVDEGHRMVAPLAQQIFGCLMHFSYNKGDVEFIEEGSELRRACPRICNNGTCNGGRCHPRYPGHPVRDPRPICDCSSVVQNGLYCNKDLRRYRRDGYNTYTINGSVTLKMSWNVSSTGRYCLLEVVRGDGSMTLMIEGGRLTANSTIISRIDAHKANFVNVDIRYDHNVFKTKYSESNISSSPSDAFLVNIGFSERTSDCRTLEGSYGIAMDPSYFREMRRMNSPPSKNVPVKLWRILLGPGISLLTISMLMLVTFSVIKVRQSKIVGNISGQAVVQVELQS